MREITRQMIDAAFESSRSRQRKNGRCTAAVTRFFGGKAGKIVMIVSLIVCDIACLAVFGNNAKGIFWGTAICLILIFCVLLIPIAVDIITAVRGQAKTEKMPAYVLKEAKYSMQLVKLTRQEGHASEGVKRLCEERLAKVGGTPAAFMYYEMLFYNCLSFLDLKRAEDILEKAQDCPADFARSLARMRFYYYASAKDSERVISFMEENEELLFSGAECDLGYMIDLTNMLYEYHKAKGEYEKAYGYAVMKLDGFKREAAEDALRNGGADIRKDQSLASNLHDVAEMAVMLGKREEAVFDMNSAKGLAHGSAAILAKEAEIKKMMDEMG